MQITFIWCKTSIPKLVFLLRCLEVQFLFFTNDDFIVRIEVLSGKYIHRRSFEGVKKHWQGFRSLSIWIQVYQRGLPNVFQKVTISPQMSSIFLCFRNFQWIIGFLVEDSNLPVFLTSLLATLNNTRAAIASCFEGEGRKRYQSITKLCTTYLAAATTQLL